MQVFTLGLGPPHAARSRVGQEDAVPITFIDPLGYKPVRASCVSRAAATATDASRAGVAVAANRSNRGDGVTYAYEGAAPDIGAHEANVCPADLNGDGTVNVHDLLTVLIGWGGPDGDVTGDGITNILDLLAVMIAWGDCS